VVARAATIALPQSTHATRSPPHRLFELARPIEGSRFSVLDPTHRLLHAAAHVFADSDCVSRLRDLVDIDGLARGWGADPQRWSALLEEARRAGLSRPLWYALSICHAWLQTPLPAAVLPAFAAIAPPAPVRWGMRVLLDRTLPPPVPWRERNAARSLAEKLLGLRYLWLRMPPRLLAYHALHKAVRALKRKLRTAPTADEG
jgi:hypothetical protein